MDHAWIAALDALESDLAAAEQLIADRKTTEIASWTVPTLEVPLPTELRDRARALRARQQVLLTAVAEATAQAQRQLAVTDRIGRATRRTTTRAVYIDTSA
jgi:hypothetical protein